MLKEETIEFFSGILPFSMMSRQELDPLVDSATLEFFPRGEKILEQNGSPSKYLYIIKKGGVKVYVDSDQKTETVIDYRSEGEQFGLLSLVSGDRSRANVVACEDTIAFLIEKARVMAILQNNPSVHEYFLKSFVINFIDKSHDETRMKPVGIGGADRLLFITPVRDLVRREPVTTGPDTPISEAAREMVRQGISSIVVVDRTGEPVGMVTDRDFREKVVAQGVATDEPISRIMSARLYTVEGNEFCFEALLRMMRHQIHHMPVMENGRLQGMVTNHDFMVLQGTSPTVLVKDIEKARDVAEIKKTVPRLWKTAASLLREGARAYNITGLITELVEKIINRLVELVEKEIGPPPLPYSLFIYGAGGRRELTLELKLLLGVVYGTTDDCTLATKAGEYFGLFREKLSECLVECCSPATSEMVLKSDAIRSLSGWKHFVEDWRDSMGQQGVPLAELFDSRLIRGEGDRISELRGTLQKAVAKDDELREYLVAETVENRPPLGFFKQFVVEKSGEHKNELDLFEKGIRPLVDVVRVFALEAGIVEISTRRRLHELSRQGKVEQSDDVDQIIGYLSTLLIHSQLQQIDHGLLPDSFINPDSLSELERKTLKEAFLLTARQFENLEKVSGFVDDDDPES